MHKLNHFKFLILLTLLYGCFECKDDRVDVSEGRELYQGELNVIPYQINDTVKFSSGNSPYTFICKEYSHKYENGKPVYYSDNNPCEGQYLDSYDEFIVKLNTPLSAYTGSSLHGIVKRDSVDIYLSVTSQSHTYECSKLSISMTADLRFGGFLIPDGNSPSFVDEN